MRTHFDIFFCFFFFSFRWQECRRSGSSPAHHAPAGASAARLEDAGVVMTLLQSLERGQAALYAELSKGREETKVRPL